jgi:hypothetical protein
MKHYLLSVIHAVGDPPPPEVLGPIKEHVAAWDEAVKAAGAWVFTARLDAPSTATVVRPQDGDVLLTDGPFAEGKEHVGGFTIIRVPDLDAALDWAKRLGEAIGVTIEVRPVFEVA